MKQDNLVAFRRFDKKKNELIAVMNFSGKEIKDLKIPVKKGSYEIAFSTDDSGLGGSGTSSSGTLKPDKSGYISLDLAPLSGLMIVPKKRK